MSEKRYFCSVLISGKIIMYAQERIGQHRHKWIRPCEVQYVIPEGDAEQAYATIILRRLDLFNREAYVSAPFSNQVLTTYTPDDATIAKYQDAVEQENNQPEGVAQ